jgi:hypothetical protein
LAIVLEYKVRPKRVLTWLQWYTNPDSQAAQETSVLKLPYVTLLAPIILSYVLDLWETPYYKQPYASL